jgi:HK97 family phage prohead protease
MPNENDFLNVPFEMKADSLSEDGTFEGYGSIFGGEPDAYGDVVKKGAFTDTIAAGGRNGFGIAMLYQHQPSEPIGTWKEIREDKKGLYVKGKLIRGVQKADEAYLLMKEKALRGLSIGYDVEDYEIVEDKKNNRRTRYLKKVSLWEISPVTFPALVRAQITNVKNAIKEAKSERELETALREAGLSWGQAKDITFMCRDYLRGIKNEQSMFMKSVLEGLSKVNAELSLFSEEKPYPNEHACRLNDPGKYKKMRRQNNWRKHEGKRIDVIWGIKSNGDTEIQALRMPKDEWSASQARSYCSSKGGSFEAAG